MPTPVVTNGRRTIRQWMNTYNELVRLARVYNIRRGPDGALLHELTNLRVSNDAAAARVRALETHITAIRAGLVWTYGLPGLPDAPPATPATSDRVVARTSTPTFGIEIECLFPVRLTQAHIAQALSTAGIPTEVEMYNHSRRGHWKIVTDGSLSPNSGTSAYEVVSPVLTGATGLEQIAKVCTTLNGLGAIVNRSCGFHVHVGVSNDLDNVHFFRRLVRLYKQHMPLIEQVLAPSRRQAANHYCRDFRHHTEAALENCRTAADVMNLVNGSEPRGDRYYKLNLNAYFRHRTVEFRQHQGTLDAQKATMWTRFCLKLVAAAAKTTTLVTSDNLTGLLEQIEASEDERSFFLARQAHFQQLENAGDV